MNNIKCKHYAKLHNDFGDHVIEWCPEILCNYVRRIEGEEMEYWQYALEVINRVGYMA